MVAYLPSIPYPPPSTGYWGPVTATLDWCEENYYATPYIAEIINSLTNATFAYLGYRGVRDIIQNGHDKVFLVGFVAYLIIGLGSFAFHSSLTYSMQLVDEISMIYTSCVLVYASFSYGSTAPKKIAIAAFTAFLAVFITVYYFYLGDPVFHQVAFAILTTVVLFRNIYVMEMTLRPSRRNKSLAIASQAAASDKGTLPSGIPVPHAATSKSGAKVEQAEQLRRDARDTAIIRQMYGMVGFALIMAYGGFGLWNLDNIYCSTIKRWRYELGMPWGFILEGHGWWHIMTGTAAYVNITWNIWIRCCLKDEHDDVELVWPRLFLSMPTIRRKSAAERANGSAKNGKKKRV